LVECLPSLQQDPNRPEGGLKVHADEDGFGGDDAADCRGCLVAILAQRKLSGLYYLVTGIGYTFSQEKGRDQAFVQVNCSEILFHPFA